jgi:hypothetical protein
VLSARRFGVRQKPCPRKKSPNKSILAVSRPALLINLYHSTTVSYPTIEVGNQKQAFFSVFSRAKNKSPRAPNRRQERESPTNAVLRNCSQARIKFGQRVCGVLLILNQNDVPDTAGCPATRLERSRSRTSPRSVFSSSRAFPHASQVTGQPVGGGILALVLLARRYSNREWLKTLRELTLAMYSVS